MQFHLEKDELNLLADVLLEQDSRQYGELLSKVMSHDLRFDGCELMQTADLLAARRDQLKREIACTPDTASNADSHQKLALLERVLDRVNECCVMF